MSEEAKRIVEWLEAEAREYEAMGARHVAAVLVDAAASIRAGAHEDR